MRPRSEFLLALGSNFTLKDGKLTIEANPWLIPIKNNYKTLEKEYFKFELDETLSETEKEAALIPLRSTWRGIWDSIRTKIINYNGHIYISELEMAA